MASVDRFRASTAPGDCPVTGAFGTAAKPLTLSGATTMLSLYPGSLIAAGFPRGVLSDTLAGVVDHGNGVVRGAENQGKSLVRKQHHHARRGTARPHGNHRGLDIIQRIHDVEDGGGGCAVRKQWIRNEGSKLDTTRGAAAAGSCWNWNFRKKSVRHWSPAAIRRERVGSNAKPPRT